jgi:hypothetical protein
LPRSVAHTLTMVVLIVALSSCADMSMHPASHTYSKLSFQATAELLDAQARQCWSEDTTVLHTGVLVDSRKADGGARISAIRNSYGHGQSYPFLEIDVKPSNGGAIVEVSERVYECVFFIGCETKNLAPDVERWLSGDRSCSA